MACELEQHARYCYTLSLQYLQEKKKVLFGIHSWRVCVCVCVCEKKVDSVVDIRLGLLLGYMGLVGEDRRERERGG